MMGGLKGQARKLGCDPPQATTNYCEASNTGMTELLLVVMQAQESAREGL